MCDASCLCATGYKCSYYNLSYDVRSLLWAEAQPTLDLSAETKSTVSYDRHKPVRASGIYLSKAVHKSGKLLTLAESGAF